MTPEERKQWQDSMKELMQLNADFSELSKRFTDLYEKIDKKLDEGEQRMNWMQILDLIVKLWPIIKQILDEIGNNEAKKAAEEAVASAIKMVMGEGAKDENTVKGIVANALGVGIDKFA